MNLDIILDRPYFAYAIFSYDSEKNIKSDIKKLYLDSTSNWSDSETLLVKKSLTDSPESVNKLKKYLELNAASYASNEIQFFKNLIATA